MAGNTIPKFLKKDGDALLFNNDSGEFVFYVPEIYFDRKNAIIIGEYVNLIGILDYAIFDAKGNHGGLKPFRFPTVFLSKPSTIEKLKDVKLTATSSKQDYRLLKYKKGDQIVVSTKVPQSIVNTEEFYGLFLGGKLPTTIPYDKLHEYFIENIELNGAKYGVTTQLFGIVISEICRDPSNLSRPFRLAKSKSMYDYVAVNIKDCPKYVSPYVAITSENWDESMVNAILNKDPKYSPMEKLLTT
jgi:hypothetical protein